MTDTLKFLCPTPADCHSPLQLKGAKAGVEILHDIHLGKYKNIMLKVDPDVDGFTSSASLFIYLALLCNQINTTIHPVFSENKTHGLNEREWQNVLGQLPDGCQPDLVILPDAGSDKESFRMYEQIGVPVLVIDHHPIENEIPSNCVMVNCTDGSYPNPTLTGVGVVTKLMEAYGSVFPLGVAEEVQIILDELLALGLIGDVADLRNPESRYYALLGVEAMKNDLEALTMGKQACYSIISHIFANNEYAIKHGPTITSVGWYVAPLLNALIRVGTLEDKQDLFSALTMEAGLIPYQPRRKKKTDSRPAVQHITRQEDMARRCRNIKAKQDKLVRKAFKKYKDMVTVDQRENDTAIVVCRDCDDETPRSLTGLIAAKLTNEFKRPALLLTENNGLLQGSGRGFERGGIEDFKALLASTECCQMLAGHANAFGVHLETKQLTELVKAVNEAAPLSELEIRETVDYEVDASRLTPEMVQEVGVTYELWGNHVEEPKFAIKNIRLTADQIESFNKGMTLVFNFNGVRYVKKHCAHTAYKDITLCDRHTLGKSKKNLELLVIGTFQTEKYEGEDRPFVQINNWCSWEAPEWDDDVF